MNNTLTKVFNEVMAREGKKLTTYYEKAEFTAFFRRNSDGINSRDTVIMFYDKNAPVKQGTLFYLDGIVYIALNREHVEGAVYWKSAIEKTNGKITLNDLSVVDIPVYGAAMNSSLAIDGSYFSISDGYTTFITEDNEKSRKLALDDTFNEWGRTWKIEQIYFRDGIAYIIANIHVNEMPKYSYKLVINEIETAVNVGSTAKVTATAYIDDEIVSDAEITYKSSNDTVAKIDSDGNIEYLAAGDVYFIVTWSGHDLEQRTKTVKIIEKVADNYELFIEKLETLYDSMGEQTLEYYVTNNGVKVPDIPVEFAIENPTYSSNYSKYLTMSYDDTTVYLESNNVKLINKSFDLVARNIEYGLESRQTIIIKSFF